MTRVNKSLNSYTAITLCVLIVLSCLCSFVCITEGEGGNAQFFAAKLYLAFAPVAKPSLSNSSASAAVSWIRNQDFTFENEISSVKALKMPYFSSDKLFFDLNSSNTDNYADKKIIRYFLRI